MKAKEPTTSRDRGAERSKRSPSHISPRGCKMYPRAAMASMDATWKDCGCHPHQDSEA